MSSEHAPDHRKKNPDPQKKSREYRNDLLGDAIYICRKLRQLGERLIEEHPEIFPDLTFARSIQLAFDFPLKKPRGQSPSMVTSGRDLVRVYMEALKKASFESRYLIPGHVFCFWCQKIDCVHSSPPQRDYVFSGYSPTGRPEWKNFLEELITSGVIHVDRLFEEPAEVIILIKRGQELKKEQLEEFGQNANYFNIVAQLIAGYLPLNSVSNERIALSVQIIESAIMGDSPHYFLNILGLTYDDLEESPSRIETWNKQALRDLFKSTRNQLWGLRNRGRAFQKKGERPVELAEVAQSILTKLKGGMERLFRKRIHTTFHAREGLVEKSRPVDSALKDLSNVRDGELFFDTRDGTYIILGPKKRVHVYSPEAKIVTSIKLERDAITKRISNKRWIPLKREDIERFRKNFMDHGKK